LRSLARSFFCWLLHVLVQCTCSAAQQQAPHRRSADHERSLLLSRPSSGPKAPASCRRADDVQTACWSGRIGSSARIINPAARRLPPGAPPAADRQATRAHGHLACHDGAEAGRHNPGRQPPAPRCLPRGVSVCLCGLRRPGRASSRAEAARPRACVTHCPRARVQGAAGAAGPGDRPRLRLRGEPIQGVDVAGGRHRSTG
jgi:hypothetical protein